MASTHAPALPRPRLALGIVDAAVAAVALLVVAWMSLLTPAFTDYEVEIEPTLRALVHGDLAAVGRIIPIYGGSLAVQSPFSALGYWLGGDLGMFRLTAIPGAAAMLALAVLGARWVRAAGRSRREQLAVIVLVAASPALAQSWATGHHEEVLVAAGAVGGILMVDAAGTDRRRLLYLGALCLGLAVGGKLWPAALVPVAVAATRTRGDALRVLLTTAGTSFALVVPNVLAHLSFFTANVSAIGGGGVFTPGNVWWFLGARNPDWVDPRLGTRAFHAGGTSFRTTPDVVTSVAHPLVIAIAVGLTVAWWWRMRAAGDTVTPARRTASLLLLIGAVVWWRAILDGWFQPYYLTAAIAALALADARRGRFPAVAAVAWGALWLLAGQNSITTNWSPDLLSASLLVWTVPVGGVVGDARSTIRWMIAVRQRLGTHLGSARRTVAGDQLIEALVIALATGLAAASLREYIAPDYKAEYLPALQGFADRGLAGYIEGLPGYPGAVILQFPLVLLTSALGLGEEATWRFLSAASISALALAVLSFLPLLRAATVPRGAGRVAVFLAVASPGAYWALRIGHPEELLTVALTIGAVSAAARGRAGLAGLLLGLAAGKAWPVVAALPVFGLLLPSGWRIVKAAAAAGVAMAVLYLPPLVHHATSVNVLARLGENTIFNVGQVWWWFGSPIPMSNVALQSVPQPRVGPTWTGELSHPLILGVGTAIGLLWCLTRAGALSDRGSRGLSFAALRADGRDRSMQEAAYLAGAACLVMAGILYARCYLDTWNVPYYLLAGLVLGALGEALVGRWPVISLVATGVMWQFHKPGDLTIRTAPDLYNAMFVGWSVPFSIAFIALGLAAARGSLSVPGRRRTP
ncbi:MAG: hypothetical protein PGN13_07950 [Patulibacter minatonensis]